MKIKPGVIVDGIHPQMLRASAIVDEIYKEFGQHDVTMTSCKDGKHKADSLHYEGRACDYRKKDVTAGQYVLILHAIRQKLEPLQYDVIDEETHLHIEYEGE